MNKAKQIIIGMLSGLGAFDPVMKSLMEDATAATLLLDEIKIKKLDLFEAHRDGKSIFERDKTWENFPVFLQMLERSGERFEIADLKRVIVNDKSILDFAVEKKKLDKLMVPEIWKGRLSKMEELWFEIPKSDKTDYDFLNLRRKVAEATSHVLREDQLSSMGISTQEMKDALRDGGDKLEAVAQKLKENGDHLRKDDLFIFDADGDTVMNLPLFWKTFDQVALMLSDNGEALDVEDFLKHNGTRNSGLVAAENNTSSFNKGLTNLFNAAVWKGRPQAMLELYDHVKEEKRSEIDLPAVLSEVIESTYEDVIDVDSGLSLADLVVPLADIGEEKMSGYEFRALGMDFVWQKMDDIVAGLEASGEKITLADLKKPHGYGAETCLSSAVRKEHLHTVLDILEKNGERLSVEDLTNEDLEGGASLLEIIGESYQIPVLLTPELWQGHKDEFKQLWEALDDKYKSQVDEQDLISAVNRGSLRERFKRKGPSAPTAGGPS